MPLDLGADREPISLSALEFDVLWEHLDLGAMPLVVKVPSPGKTYEERAELVQQAWADMESRGIGRPVDIDPEVDHLLRLLAKPEREVDGRTYVERSARALAVSVGEDAVLAVLCDDELTLRRASAASLASAVIGVLPSRPAGPGQSVTLPTEHFEAAAEASDGSRKSLEAELLSRGVRADDAEALSGMIDKVYGTGNFGAAARDRLGRRRRLDRVVAFFDTEHGRYVQIRRPSLGDGTMWTTVSPADVRKLTHHVEELLTEVVKAVEE